MNDSNAPRLLRSFLAATGIVLALLSPSTAAAICGDGVVEQNEECDDGNVVGGDCCASDCTAEPVEGPCDDSNECTFDFCDGQGNCLSFPGQGACDDGNDCTQDDQCNPDGFCFGTETLPDGSVCFDDDLCGGSGNCFNAFCSGDPANCEGYGGACNPAVCDPEKRLCEVTQLDDGTPCDNPDACTDPGECSGGECIQPPVDCSDFADSCNDAFCDVEANGCFSVWKENGTTCDDTNGCTEAGECDDGDCITDTLKDCSSFADQCNDAACDEKSEDGCFASPKEDGTPCDDGDGCTADDACNEGACVGAPRDCSEFDDECHVGICNGDTGTCQGDLVEDETPCNDGDLCTSNDQCSNGVCGGVLLDCSGLDDQCNSGFCDGQTGQCEKVPVEEPQSCNDGDLCTTGDECDAGECTGTPVDCSGSDDQCNTGSCNTESGQCDTIPLEGTPPCNDGDLCTTGDQCDAGECSGTPVDCSGEGDVCNNGFCNAETGECDTAPVEGTPPCNDGDLCTTGDQCDAGECSGTPVDCSGSDDQCNTGFCNAQTGQCDTAAVEGTPPCNDGDACTTNDQCAEGTCAGDDVDCSAEGGACTVGTCNPDSGECDGQPVQDGTVCDDGNLCTGSDQCVSGACTGTPADCSGLTNDCNVGQCNAGTGACVAVPREDGTTCSDGVACTGSDQCTAGACAGAAVDCSNLTGPCRAGVCNSTSGVCEALPAPDGSGCDDAAFCTLTDTCTGGICVGTGDPCAGNPTCTATCNEGANTCATGAGTPCQADGNPCTDDVCDGAGNCGTFAAEGVCDDGLFCTTADRCVEGECVGDPACPSTGACSDTCDEVDDACRTCGHPFSNSRCIVNAVVVLQGALGLRPCELCTCDVNSDGQVTASDALMILRTCVSLPSNLDCQEPDSTTTTTTPTSSTTLGN
ncbi:MAG: hypothetical protein ABR587_04050 [Candidatus Binatia bacterium]